MVHTMANKAGMPEEDESTEVLQPDTQDEPTPVYALDIHTNLERRTPGGKPKRSRKSPVGWWWIAGGLITLSLLSRIIPSESDPAKSIRTTNDTPAVATRPAPPKKDPYSGGTLHRELMFEWVFASEQERVATAAGFAAPLFKNRGRNKAGQPTGDLKYYTHLLVACISEHADADIVNYTRISHVAARCIALMNAPHLLSPQN